MNVTQRDWGPVSQGCTDCVDEEQVFLCTFLFLTFRMATVLLALLFFAATARRVTHELEYQGLDLTVTNYPRPKLTFYKPEDIERYGVYTFEFVGLAEASGYPLTIKEDTKLEPKPWSLSPVRDNGEARVFTFNYTVGMW